MKSDDQSLAKKAAGKKAASLVEDGMLVGLGTGTTAAYFIEFLIERCKSEPLKVRAIATSLKSEAQAAAGGIPLLPPETVTTLDMTVDGADEIDRQKRMIKGGGGALLREKIIASSSKKTVIVVDAKKVVDRLGSFPLPIEISPFAYNATLYKVRKLGFDGHLRVAKEGGLYRTDNGNLIIDIAFPNRCTSPEKDHAALIAVPGVLETGFFFHLASQVIIGNEEGTAEIHDDLNNASCNLR